MADRIEDVSRSYARDLRAARKAPRTVILYTQTVRLFAEWLVASGRPATLDEMTKHALSAWFADLHETRQPGTVLTRFKGMRRFTRWLVANDEIDRDPMANLEQPRAPVIAVPVISDDELRRLLKVCGGNTFVDRRDTAIMRVLLDCGLRISELAGLAVDDVDLAHHDVLHVMGKGSRPRAVPFGPKTGKALDVYIRRFRAHHPYARASALLLGQRGPVSRDGVDHIIRRRGAQAGIPNLHAHRFRHTFADAYMRAGGQQVDLKRLAGWTSDAMLERYGSQMADDRAHEAFRRLGAGDRV